MYIAENLRLLLDFIKIYNIFYIVFLTNLYLSITENLRNFDHTLYYTLIAENSLQVNMQIIINRPIKLASACGPSIPHMLPFLQSNFQTYGTENRK